LPLPSTASTNKNATASADDLAAVGAEDGENKIGEQTLEQLQASAAFT